MSFLDTIKNWFTRDKPMQENHVVRASSFADPGDIEAFRKAKAKGWTDQQAFKVGDNGIGFWGDDTTTDTPMCALPHEDWKERWGQDENARLRKVVISANGKTIVCLLGDTMPYRANIENGRGIDLNYAAVKALGLSIPVDCKATWSWA